MKKILILLIVAVAAFVARGASDQWRVFNTFDNSVEKVVVTPYYAYFLCNGIEYNPKVNALKEKKCYLFQYEIDKDELKQYNSSNVLSGTIVSSIDYDPRHRKLYVIFDTGDIDILNEKGGIMRVKGLSMADLNGSKNVNSVSFDTRTSNAYLATDFGYVIVNGEKGEIESSLNAGKPLNAVTKLGDYYVIATEDGLMTASAGRPHFNLDEFQMKIPMTDVTDFLALGEKYCAVVHGPQGYWKVDYIDIDDDGNLQLSDGFQIGRRYITHNPNGHLLVTQTQAIQLNWDRNYTRLILPDEHRYRWSSSWNGKEFWFAEPRKGFYSMKVTGDDAQREWTITRDIFAPNSPSVMTSTGMTYHPKYGVLVNPRGIDRVFTTHDVNFVTTLCGWKDGEWTQYSPAWLNPDRTNVSVDPTGLTIDKDNTDYVYMGSFKSGITRLNLKDPNDILHMTHPGDADASNPGYVKVAETLVWFPEMCNMQAPQFDTEGNLWSLRVACNPTDPNPASLYPELYGWSAANRKASVNAANFRPWTVTPLQKIASSNFLTFRVLTHSRQNTLIIFSSNQKSPSSDISPLTILDTKGTVDNGNDDTMINMLTYVDQDGSSVQFNYIYDLYEDQQTGLVWVATNQGVFTIDPTVQTSGIASVGRIKVSRNDGTSLADYLLNGASVTKITSTPDGRKWFAIEDGGIVITTSDGRTILNEITTSNSDIPSNSVYDLCYNPDNNSMIVSTDKGLAEYYLPGVSGAENKSSVRVYPNPVHPDYFGYVTIDGLEDNSLVKIIDSGGNIVKELGFASDGIIQWDVTNMNMKRVPAGVYYVLASSGPDSSGFANVGKLLVIN